LFDSVNNVNLIAFETRGKPTMPAPVIVHHKYTDRVPLSLYTAEPQFTQKRMQQRHFVFDKLTIHNNNQPLMIEACFRLTDKCHGSLAKPLEPAWNGALNNTCQHRGSLPQGGAML
jgi:hypothetical protein